MLYCIKHGRMEKSQTLFDTVKITHPDGGNDEWAIPICYLHEVNIPESADQPEEIDWCEFDMGWTTCPPPPFDMDTFMERLEEEL